MTTFDFDVEDGMPNIEIQLSGEEAKRFENFMIQVTEVLKDKKRIDWLEKMANESNGILLHDGSQINIVHNGLGLRPGRLVRTLREACDTAGALG